MAVRVRGRTAAGLLCTWGKTQRKALSLWPQPYFQPARGAGRGARLLPTLPGLQMGACSTVVDARMDFSRSLSRSRSRSLSDTDDPDCLVMCVGPPETQVKGSERAAGTAIPPREHRLLFASLALQRNSSIQGHPEQDRQGRVCQNPGKSHNSHPGAISSFQGTTFQQADCQLPLSGRRGKSKEAPNKRDGRGWFEGASGMVPGGE